MVAIVTRNSGEILISQGLLSLNEHSQKVFGDAANEDDIMNSLPPVRPTPSRTYAFKHPNIRTSKPS